MVEEKTVLVGVSLKIDPETKVEEYLDELEFLAETAGAITVKRFTQKLDYINPKTFVGTGKIQEIAEYVQENEIDLVIFDEELSPSQLRNLDKIFEARILDRTNLILDIFAKRAQTAVAKTQVELAQYQYILPRLTGMWTHLERQRGGIGLRGPGEKEIETDRRVIRDRIAKLKTDLQKIDKQMLTQRKNRGKLVRVALIGYTNVGKSTLMNILSKADVFAENKLFATLDTTVRKIAIGNLPFLLTDTVGFIRKLPHHLVEAFKSTLDEVREADFLIHVVDISHPNFDEQLDVVISTLKDLDSADKKSMIVFNKIDAYSYTPKDEFDLTPKEKENYSLEELKQMWIGKTQDMSVFISAKKRINIEELRKMMYDEIRKIHVSRFPYDDLYYPDYDEELEQ
ncbi:MAG: GTPase HflX [Bacteroidales bacterium]|nr:GTPase HflX [Bacteroidales bacterium]